MQFVGNMLLYIWEKLACESIPKPKLQQVGQKLKRLFIGQTCSEQNLNCRTLRNSNMPPLAASEAKSLTVGKRQGHRPAFHQNNPNILVKIETDSSMSPVNVLEGNFGLTRPLIDWTVLSLESLQVAATRSGLFVLRTMQLLQRRRHRAGWKFCGSQGGEHMCWQGSMISRSRQRAASLNLQHRTPWYRKQKDRKNYSIRLSDQKLFLLQSLDAWIYSEDVHWWNSTKCGQHFLTDITLGLQNPQAATTSRTNVQLGLPVSWPGAVQG